MENPAEGQDAGRQAVGVECVPLSCELRVHLCSARFKFSGNYRFHNEFPSFVAGFKKYIAIGQITATEHGAPTGLRVLIGSLA